MSCFAAKGAGDRSDDAVERLRGSPGSAAEHEQEPKRTEVKKTMTRRELEQRIAVLQQVCGEAYQLAGAVGAPEKALDNLSAAANGDPIPHASFLPLTAADCDEFTGTRTGESGAP